jgi:sulfur carrier protein
MSDMTLTINGQERTIPDGTSLEAAIALLTKDPALVIAELNGRVTDRTAWSQTQLGPNDRLELVCFVGGG